MDYLFRKVVLNIPETYTITTYYIVNDSLKYVSLLKDQSYYLGYVDSDYIGDFIIDDISEGTLDAYVIKQNIPIISCTSTLETDNNVTARVVSITAEGGNSKTTKKKKSQDVEVLNRYQNKGRNKLF